MAKVATLKAAATWRGVAAAYQTGGHGVARGSPLTARRP